MTGAWLADWLLYVSFGAAVLAFLAMIVLAEIDAYHIRKADARRFEEYRKRLPDHLC